MGPRLIFFCFYDTKIFLLKPQLSGKYPAVVNGANGSVLEIPGSSVTGDSDGNRGSRLLAVGYSLAELLLLKLFHHLRQRRNMDMEGSRFALIFSSIKSGEMKPVLVSPFCSASFGPDAAVDWSSWADISGRHCKS